MRSLLWLMIIWNFLVGHTGMKKKKPKMRFLHLVYLQYNVGSEYCDGRRRKVLIRTDAVEDTRDLYTSKLRELYNAVAVYNNYITESKKDTIAAVVRVELRPIDFVPNSGEWFNSVTWRWEYPNGNSTDAEDEEEDDA